MTSMHFEDLFSLNGQLNGAARTLEMGETITDRIRVEEAVDEPRR